MNNIVNINIREQNKIVNNVNIVNNFVLLPDVNVNNVIHGFSGGFVMLTMLVPKIFSHMLCLTCFFSRLRRLWLMLM